jgi:hypothetical protein
MFYYFRGRIRDLAVWETYKKLPVVTPMGSGDLPSMKSTSLIVYFNFEKTNWLIN